MRTRFRPTTYSPEGVRYAIHFLLIVVLFVCIGMRSCANSHEPGCFVNYSEKVPAQIVSSDGIDFVENNGWKPNATPGTSVYIVYVQSGASGTCTIMLDNVDPLRRSYASEVPLSSLLYVKTDLDSVTSWGNVSSAVYTESSGDSAPEIALNVVIFVIAAYLIGLLMRFIARTFLGGR